jgi:hypothetical protein
MSSIINISELINNCVGASIGDDIKGLEYDNSPIDICCCRCGNKYDEKDDCCDKITCKSKQISSYGNEIKKNNYMC